MENNVQCPTCKGAGKYPVVAQLFTGKGFVAQPPVDITCPKCDGAGSISELEIARGKAQAKIWCQCGEGYDRTKFHDDGNSEFYLADGFEFTISKHHYSCGNCGGVVQIG